MAVRLTRISTQVGIVQLPSTRLTRISTQVAVSDMADPVLRGPRRAGVILQRHPDTIERG